MKNLLLIILYYFSATLMQAQAPLPYYTGFNNPAEENGWEQYRVGEAADGIYEWHIGGQTLNHGYPVGGEEITDDWMVSPEFDFSNGAVIDSMSFKSAGFGTPFGLDTIAVYHLHAYANPDFAISKTLLKLITSEDFQNDNIWKTFYNLEIEPISGISFIGFRYKTVVNWFDVAIDDVYISSGSVSIEERLSDPDLISVFPNPVINKITIQAPESLNINNITISDIRGEVIYATNSAICDFNFSNIPPGVYILSVQTERSRILKKLIKG